LICFEIENLTPIAIELEKNIQDILEIFLCRTFKFMKILLIDTIARVPNKYESQTMIF